MPMVHVNLIERAFDDNEKKDVIAGITDVFARVKGEKFAELVVVMLHEVASGDVGKAGKPITLEQVREHETVG